jgi:drug/metabolite transporter (DMT)-like permease
MSNVALFLVPALIWGSTWLAITAQLGVVAPEVSVTYRFAAASLLLTLGCIATRRSLRFSLRDHAFLAGVGLLMICINYNFIYWAERVIISGLVAVVYSTLVFMSPIAMRVAFGTPLRVRVLSSRRPSESPACYSSCRSTPGAGWDRRLNIGLALAAPPRRRPVT